MLVVETEDHGLERERRCSAVSMIITVLDSSAAELRVRIDRQASSCMSAAAVAAVQREKPFIG